MNPFPSAQSPTPLQQGLAMSPPQSPLAVPPPQSPLAMSPPPSPLAVSPPWSPMAMPPPLCALSSVPSSHAPSSVPSGCASSSVPSGHAPSPHLAMPPDLSGGKPPCVDPIGWRATTYNYTWYSLSWPQRLSSAPRNPGPPPPKDGPGIQRGASRSPGDPAKWRDCQGLGQA